jgi:hypothetical protein
LYVSRDESNANRDSDPEIISGDNTGETGYMISPTPGFVIKTKRKQGDKVFINVCEHYDIPTVSTAIGTLKSNLKWPAMITSPGRTFKDEDKEKGKIESAVLYDVVVHPSVLLLCQNDESLSTRDLVGGDFC